MREEWRDASLLPRGSPWVLGAIAQSCVSRTGPVVFGCAPDDVGVSLVVEL